MVAAAQNTNNTTIRSILQQEKLTGPNFTNWYRNLRIILRFEGKLAHLEQPLILFPYPVAYQATRDAYNVLYDAQNEVACLILGSMSLEFQRALENYEAYDMIQELKTMFEEQAKHELFKIVKAFHACKHEEGYVMPNELGVSLNLNSLNKDYDQFIQNYKMHSMGKPIAELHAMLKLHEKGIPKKVETPAVLAIWEGKIKKDKKKPRGKKGKDKEKNKLAYAPKPKIPPPPKRDNPAKDSVCHHYKEEVETMGNGMRAAVEAIRSFDLILPSGLIIVLDNSTKEPNMHLDSFYLWHCRLGHINKKRMDKLQHDGILQPTHDESLEKCKSCISEKMARKPFPHQEEKAKDLLGLIHTDLCGFFRSVSIEVKMTPYEIWHKKAPKLSYLRGCEALVKRDALDKLDPRSINCIFVGYPKETMGYYFYYPIENKIFVALNAEFFGNSLIVQEAKPYENTSKIHNEVAPIEVEPQNVKVSIRRSTGIPQAPDRYGFYVDVEEYELGDLNEPPNYKASLLYPKFDKCLEAMNTEMQSMKDNQVWVLVDLPPNGRTVGSKWLFKKKTDMDGNVHAFKARLVAKGYTKTYDVDYGETFSLVADRFVDLKHPNKVCKLQRFIYGLKQASRSWNKRFDVEIKKISFTQNPDKPCVYLKASGSNVAFLILYVDDILLMGNNVTMLQEVKSYLCKCFSMKDLGIAAYILGIKIIRNRSKWLIALSQSAYLEKILKRCLMENSKKGYTLIIENPDYRKSQGAKTPTEDKNETKSQMGYVFILNAVWMRKFIDGLGGVVPSNKRPMHMLCDNEPAIAIANDPEFLKGARHFQRKNHYIREVIQERETVLEKVHTYDNVVDPFTKPVSYDKNYKHAMTIGIVPARSLM
nr:hypothetical protein [Tanacetum cinerariifolium]